MVALLLAFHLYLFQIQNEFVKNTKDVKQVQCVYTIKLKNRNPDREYNNTSLYANQLNLAYSAVCRI